MQRHFDEELKKLKDKLFKMGVLAQESIQKSTQALINRDIKLAQNVIDDDQKINVLEIEVDEFGHELIALMQPTARDLRFITMVLKINSDLERIGDQSVNIAEKSLDMSREAPPKSYFQIPEMTRFSIAMLRDALTAFMERDPEKAKDVCERDDQIDDLNDNTYDELQSLMQEDKGSIQQAVSLIMVAHNLERIGDLATNIAEDVIYLAKGIDIRHHITERRGN